MRRNEIELQRTELIEHLQNLPVAGDKKANPLYRKAKLLLTNKWIRTPAVHRVGLLKAAVWLISVADNNPFV
jgi:hypothetical protein